RSRATWVGRLATELEDWEYVFPPDAWACLHLHGCVHIGSSRQQHGVEVRAFGDQPSCRDLGLCSHRYDNFATLDRRRGAEHGPRLRELAPLLKQIGSRIGSRRLAARDMRQGTLADLVRERRALAAPIPKRRPKTVDRLAAPQAAHHPQRLGMMKLAVRM